MFNSKAEIHSFIDNSIKDFPPNVDNFTWLYSNTLDFINDAGPAIMSIYRAVVSDGNIDDLESSFPRIGAAIDLSVLPQIEQAYYNPPPGLINAPLIQWLLYGAALSLFDRKGASASQSFMAAVSLIGVKNNIRAKEARDRGLRRFYSDIEKYLSKSNRRGGESFTFDEFSAVSEYPYSYLSGKGYNARRIRLGMKRALVGAKYEIVKRNIYRYGSPSIYGDTYGCRIKLEMSDREPPQAKEASVKAIKEWLALVAPAIIEGPVPFSVNIKINKEGSDIINSLGGAAALYIPDKSLVLVREIVPEWGEDNKDINRNIIKRNAEIFHEMTHILGNVNPPVFGGGEESGGGWGQPEATPPGRSAGGYTFARGSGTFSGGGGGSGEIEPTLRDTAICLLSYLVMKNSPQTPYNKIARVITEYSTPDNLVFGVPDSLTNQYTGVFYPHTPHTAKRGEHPKMEISETEVSTCAVMAFASPEDMLAMFMTERDLFSHALAIFYGEYFTEDGATEED